MTTAELINRLMRYPGLRKVNCLEVPEDGSIEGQKLYHIVNIHEDLTGVHLIIELRDGEK